jgi:hypothetical protein
MPTAAFLILDSAYVPAQRGEAEYYEIAVATDDLPRAPKLVLLTRDPVLYARALLWEGSPRTVVVSYRPGTQPNGKRCQVLTDLQPLGAGR